MSGFSERVYSITARETRNPHFEQDRYAFPKHCLIDMIALDHMFHTALDTALCFHVLGGPRSPSSSHLYLQGRKTIATPRCVSELQPLTIF